MENYELLTIGYEGRNIDDFISCLKQYNTTCLIDVREIPISRKNGFSKRSLKGRLENENIKYIHIKALGTPSVIRKKLRADKDYNSFFNEYSKYLTNNIDIIRNLYNNIFEGTSCLMCFERSHEKCHRSIVANKIKEFNGEKIKIKHI
jgi:uncharacterized protein (DUF488 family)